MSLRVQSAPAFFGVFLSVSAFICGCSSEEQAFLPPAGGQGGATVGNTGSGMTYATGGYKPATSYTYPQQGGSPATTVPATGVGGTTGAATTTSAVVAKGGTTSNSTASTKATGGTVTATTTAATTNPNTGKTVTFKAGKAEGAMSGYGYVALGSDDEVTSPDCDGTPITSSAPCESGTKWEADTSLCITGSIPALPAKPVDADYASNWGVSIGINATNPDSGTLNQAHTSIAFTITGKPTTGLRAQVSIGSIDYCYDKVASGTAIPFTSFNTACWDNSGTSLTAANVAKIEKVALQVSSSSTAITVTSLCITGITFK
jgi:hypothetical protein